MDYYSILGVNKSASPEEIKRAYRKLAMQHHPDRGGDASKLQEINEAYDTLKNPQKKQEYDNPQRRYNTQNMNEDMFRDNFGNFDDIFNHMFGGQRGPHPNRPANRDITISITLNLEEIVQGKKVTVQYKTTRGMEHAELNIPPGVQQGQTIRYNGMGDNALAEFPRGSLIVIVKYARHRYWTVDGPNLKATEKLDILQLLKGSKIDLTTIDGSTIRLSIPKGTTPGTTFSINGAGLPMNQRHRGNAYIKVNAIMPDLTDEQLMQIENIIYNH